MMKHQLERNAWLVTCMFCTLHTINAQVPVYSTPNTFVMTCVICPTQFCLSLALSVQMLCSYMPVGLLFRLDLECRMLGLSRFMLA